MIKNGGLGGICSSCIFLRKKLSKSYLLFSYHWCVGSFHFPNKHFLGRASHSVMQQCLWISKGNGIVCTQRSVLNNVGKVKVCFQLVEACEAEGSVCGEGQPSWCICVGFHKAFNKAPH